MLKGYKTFIINGFVALSMVVALVWPGAELPTAEQVGDAVDATDKLITDGQAVFGLLLALGNMILRAVTSTPVFFRKDGPSGSTARSPWQIGVLALLMGLLLSGCGISNPFKYAETPEQRYVAVSGTYEIILETANEIVQNEATPLEVVQAIDDVQKRTTGVMDALDQAFLDYMVAKAELETGETSQERLDILSANLGQYLDQAMRAYRDLAAAVD